jgi:uncharacterized Zn finger protein (UPF0148 family)
MSTMPTLSIGCRVCGHPTTIAIDGPRICPRCLGRRGKTRDELRARITEQEARLAQSMRAFAEQVASADPATQQRWIKVVGARIACGGDLTLWAKQKAREIITLDLGDGLSDLLQLETRLDSVCREITHEITRHQETLLDLEHAPAEVEWSVIATMPLEPTPAQATMLEAA